MEPGARLGWWFHVSDKLRRYDIDQAPTLFGGCVTQAHSIVDHYVSCPDVEEVVMSIFLAARNSAREVGPMVTATVLLSIIFWGYVALQIFDSSFGL